MLGRNMEMEAWAASVGDRWVRPLAFKDLTPAEIKVYEFVRDNDFESRPWVTSSAARTLGMSEEDVYKALSELTKKIRDNIWIHYESGHLHISAD